MAWKLTNFANSTLRQAVELGATTIYISDTDAALWPTLGVGDKAKAVIFDASYSEIVNITARTDGTLTVERGQEGTADRAWASGVRIIHTPTAEILQLVLNTAAAAVFAGTATFLTDTYTLTVSGTIPTLSDGERVTFLIPADNPGSIDLVVTNGVDSTASKAILYQDGSEIEEADFAKGWIAEAVFNEAQDAWLVTTDTSFNEHAANLNDAHVPAVNLHPNGKLSYWRKGTTFSSPASLTETADNWWVVYDGTIGAFTVNRQTFTLGQTTVPDNPKYWIRWDQSAAGSGQTFKRFRIPILGVHHRAGKKMVRSVWLKAEAAHTVRGKVIQSFGTGGSPSADVEAFAEDWAVTTTWQRFDFTFTMPSVTGKTLGSNNDDCLYLTFELPLNVTFTIDIAEDDFRPGHIIGAYSETFPLQWRYGGINGSYQGMNDFMTDALTTAALTDLALIEALTGTGFPARTAVTPTWALRSFAVGTGLTITNPAGVAGNPTVGLDTALTNYVADPLSVAELASITGAFGTAAFVADSGLVHLTGVETITAQKKYKQAVDANLLSYENNTTTHIMVPRMASAGTLFEMTPGPSGTPDNTKGFGYDFTNSRWFCDTDMFFTGRVLGPAGSAAQPGIRVGGSEDGLYQASAGTIIGIAVGGALVWQIGTNITTNGGAILSKAGAANAPAYMARSGDTTTGIYSIATGNWGFSSGGTLKWDYDANRMLFASGFDAVLGTGATAPTSAYSVGYRGTPVVSGNSAYAFPLADSGSTVYHDEASTRTYTIPANASVAHRVGTVFVIDNTGNSGAAGAITLAITSDELRRGDGVSGTGTRTIGAGQVAQIRKVTSTRWVITGVFS